MGTRTRHYITINTPPRHTIIHSDGRIRAGQILITDFPYTVKVFSVSLDSRPIPMPVDALEVEGGRYISLAGGKD